MPYDAQGMWQPEDDSAADKLTGMLATDSPYMTQARASGQRQAQARGLQNSTLAGQSGEAAAIAAAAPIATTDANNTAQKNLSFQGFGQNSSLSAQDFNQQTQLNTQQNTQQTKITQMGLDAQASMQANDILAQQQRLSMQLQSSADLAKLQADTQVKINQMNIDDAQKRQLADIANQQLMQQNTITSNQAIAAVDAQNKLALQQMQNDIQKQIASMNVASNQQDKAQSAALTASNIYASMVNNINSNTSIPSDARAQLLSNAKSELSSNIGLIEQMYNIDLNWDFDAGSTVTAGGASSDQTASTSQAQNNNQNALDPLLHGLYGGTPQQNGNSGATSYNNYTNSNSAGSNYDITGGDDKNIAYTDDWGNQHNSAGTVIGYDETQNIHLT